MTTVLDLADQAVFDGERATGAATLIQCAWTYDNGVDLECLRRFHRHLTRGRLARRIEPAPLPFGRHHWTRTDASSRLQVCPPRRRAQFEDWLTEQAEQPLDAARGPGWRLAVVPFTEGGAGISMTASHCLTDGLGLCRALADAADGREEAPALPSAGSRRRWRAIGHDVRHTMHDLPAVTRAVGAAARLIRPGAATPTVAVRAPGEAVTLPAVTAFVDAADWDACAGRLGGSGNALLVGLAAELAGRMGRSAEGAVTVSIPVDNRSPGDTRANAVTNVDVVVDAAAVRTDLRPVRAAVRDALITRNGVADERWTLLPLVPLLPRSVFRSILGVATGAPAVVSSNLGEIDGSVNRPDGTDADTFSMRSRYPRVTSATMQRTGGVLALLSGRIGGRVFISILAYRPGESNSVAALEHTAHESLAAFTLTERTD